MAWDDGASREVRPPRIAAAAMAAAGLAVD
jgi:hypothetical protein